MEYAIEINDRIPSIFVDYNILYNNPKLSEKDLKEIFTNYRNFLNKLREQGDLIGYEFNNEDITVYFPSNYRNLKDYIELIRKVVTYVEINNFPYNSNDFSFEFSDYYSSGLISVDKDSKIIRLYYLDPKSSKLIKVKIPIGSLNKV